MRRLTLMSLVLSKLLSTSAQAEKVVIFADGTQMKVQRYEVKGSIVQFTTEDGKLRSIPLSHVNLEATERQNGRGSSATSAPARTGSSVIPPSTTQAPAPALTPQPQPRLPPSPEPEPVRPETLTPKDLSKAPSGRGGLPRTWSNEELQIALTLPSSPWVLEEVPVSFDTSFRLNNPDAQSQISMALMHRSMRSRAEFQNVVKEVGDSISTVPGYQNLSAGPLRLDSYTAHEFRFLTSSASGPAFNRLLVVYSRDLAYLLKLTCPEARVADNSPDFENLVNSLVINKPSNELRP